MPNPTTGEIAFSFGLPTASRVRIQVFDVAGKVVSTPVDEDRSAGSHHLNWDPIHSDGRPLASGIYYLRLVAEGAQRTQKLVLAR